LWWLLGNPFLALIVLLIVLYLLERRFIGLTPSFVKPFRRRSQIAKWRRQLILNPHDVSAKTELARLLIERKKYGEARELLLSMESKMEHSAEFWSDLGICDLALGSLDDGESEMLRALAISPRVKYGQPYLKLGEAYAKKDSSKALSYLQQFKQVNSSSCEAYYKLGLVYADLGQKEEAAMAFRECRHLYGTLPRYMKRHERKWVLRSLVRGRQ
jgi:tetratricopeptide (TPR) repeat protein